VAQGEELGLFTQKPSNGIHDEITTRISEQRNGEHSAEQAITAGIFDGEMGVQSSFCGPAIHGTECLDGVKDGPGTMSGWSAPGGSWPRLTAKRIFGLQFHQSQFS